MENSNGSSSQDPIPLGLFGDSLTSLQGLNDQFSPMLLQRSPPSGTLYNPSLNKQIVLSPGKQEGVLLSDLADGSPSAGSIIVASLCDHISPDSNLRCTNFINVKGKRFCNKHISSDAKFGATTSTSFKQTVSFISHVNANEITAGQKRVLKLGVKSYSSNLSGINGTDVSDNGKYKLSVNGEASKDDINKVCFVKKHTIRDGLSQAPLSRNIPPHEKSKQTAHSSFAKYVGINKANVANAQTNLKTLRLNVIKPTVSSTGLTPIKNPQTFNIKSTQLQSLGVSVNSSMQSVTTSISNQASSVPVKATQSLVVDEATLKKLVDVLNSRSDMSTQQQISLLQSLGITVLQAPPNAESMSKWNKKISTPKVITGRKIVVKEQPLLNVAGRVDGTSFSYQTGIKSGTRLPVVHSREQSLINPPPHATMPGENRSAFVQPVKSDMATTAVFAKTTVKRKQKPNIGIAAKKIKSTNTCPEPPTNTCEKSSRSSAVLQKSKLARLSIVEKKAKEELHSAPFVVPSSLPRISSLNPLNLPKIPDTASPSLQDLAAHLSEKMLLNRSIFELDFVETQPKLETDKNKTVKARLLKAHVSQKRALCTMKTNDKPFDYEHCLNDLRSTDFCKSFVAAQRLIGSNLMEKTQKRASVHHEIILNDLLMSDVTSYDADNILSEDVVLYGENGDSIYDGDTIMSDDQILYTINTRRLNYQYEKLSRELEEEQKELNIVQKSYEENPTLLTQILRSTLCTNRNTMKIVPDAMETGRKQCQLSNSNGLCCESLALPYTSYCKQHISHCPSQCLYKLNQNMKPSADIEPEPLVKRIKKRTKLPLIKKYKKKKKRKLEGDEHQAEVNKNDIQSITDIEKFEKSEAALSNTKMLKITVPVSSINNSNIMKPCSRDSSIDFNVSDIGDHKPSDTSEEDLNLTGHEIMLNGVFDKLPEDPQDFDLFTTDKGAEELERALLLAATSPSPDHEDNKLDCETSNMLLTPDSNNSWSSIKIPKSSPGAVVVCDAPRSNRSNEQPPSIESFDQSQCVHYTFGSNVLPESNANDTAESLLDDALKDESLNAEDDLNLQDIERVLDRLQKDAEDINSPKLPSSPAVDQYTSMLAKQLSQEAEKESLKQMSSTKDLLHVPTSFQITKESPLPSLTRSYSLPVTNELSGRTKMSDLTASFSAVQSCTTPKTDSQAIASNTSQANTGVKSRNNFNSGSMQHQLDMNSILPSIHRKQSTANGIYSNSPIISFPVTSLSKTDPPVTLGEVHLESMPKSTPSSVTSNNKSTNTNDTPRKLPKKSFRKFTQTVQSSVAVTNISSKNIQSPTLMANPVLPLTLMQNPSQNGNVIKVIVPPGTVVNGAGGQQNMLLIPVSALVKSGNPNVHLTPSNLSNTRVKTPLSSLQAGQQFFIVNNATTNLQSQLALMQKRNTVQQVVTTNNSGKDSNMQAGQKQGNVTGTKLALCNIKPNTTAFAKQNKNSRIGQNKVVSNNSNQCSRVANQAGGFVSLNKVASNMLHAKLFNSDSGKLTIQPQTVRRKKAPVTKVPKAKFDPVTKKYVAGTIGSTTNLTSTSLTLPLSVTTGTTEALSESMMKVQQINSVLSTLNSGTKMQQNASRVVLTNGLPEKKNKNGSWLGRSGVSATSQPSSTHIVQNAAPVTLTIPTTVSSNPVQNTRCAKENVASQTPLVSVSTSISDVKNATVAVSTGTVHWNQTTTAGPVITTPTLTVPLYITGALPTAAWPAELAVNGSVGGATMPLIIPSHKLATNCQIPRVILSSIPSLAVAPGSSRSQNSFVTFSNNSLVSVTSNSALSNAIMTSKNLRSVKVTSVPVPNSFSSGVTVKQAKVADGYSKLLSMSAVNIPMSKAHTLVLKSNHESLNSVCTTANAPSSAPLRNYGTPYTTSSIVRGSNNQVSINSTISSDFNNNVEGSISKTPTRNPSLNATRKKSSRKASHDTIMHDPLMFDPTTALEFDPGELRDGD